MTIRDLEYDEEKARELLRDLERAEREEDEALEELMLQDLQTLREELKGNLKELMALVVELRPKKAKRAVRLIHIFSVFLERLSAGPWCEMEHAPTDGTRILLKCANGNPYVCAWDSESKNWVMCLDYDAGPGDMLVREWAALS